MSQCHHPKFEQFKYHYMLYCSEWSYMLLLKWKAHIALCSGMQWSSSPVCFTWNENHRGAIYIIWYILLRSMVTYTTFNKIRWDEKKVHQPIWLGLLDYADLGNFSLKRSQKKIYLINEILDNYDATWGLRSFSIIGQLPRKFHGTLKRLT